MIYVHIITPFLIDSYLFYSLLQDIRVHLHTFRLFSLIGSKFYICICTSFISTILSKNAKRMYAKLNYKMQFKRKDKKVAPKWWENNSLNISYSPIFTLIRNKKQKQHESQHDDNIECEVNLSVKFRNQDSFTLHLPLTCTLIYITYLYFNRRFRNVNTNSYV